MLCVCVFMFSTLFPFSNTPIPSHPTPLHFSISFPLLTQEVEILTTQAAQLKQTSNATSQQQQSEHHCCLLTLYVCVGVCINVCIIQFVCRLYAFPLVDISLTHSRCDCNEQKSETTQTSAVLSRMCRILYKQIKNVLIYEPDGCKESQ